MFDMGDSNEPAVSPQLFQSFLLQRVREEWRQSGIHKPFPFPHKSDLGNKLFAASIGCHLAV